MVRVLTSSSLGIGKVLAVCPVNEADSLKSQGNMDSNPQVEETDSVISEWLQHLDRALFNIQPLNRVDFEE